MSRGRVLVLDDDVNVGATIGLIAETAGYEVVVTSRYDDFAAALDAGEPTHVTLDLSMPDVDGIEVVRRLASRGFAGSVIISSGLDGRVLDAARRSAIEHGLHFAGVLPKPFRAAELRSMLADVGRGTAPIRSPRRADVGADDLREALAQRAIEVAFQPKVSCADLRLVGVEVLARWRHPEVGVVPPDTFIPLAEREGLIDAVTEQVYGAALAWLRANDPVGTLHVAVNLSARSLGDVGLADAMERTCEAHGIHPSRVVLELTETASSDDHVTALDVLTRFRIKGFALSIDDFGTGHSTLVQLVRQPFSELKVDRQFVMGAATSEESRSVIQATVALAHGLGVLATAEGVEDADTLAFLAEIGCDRAQGYHIARPMPGAEVARWARERSGARPEGT